MRSALLLVALALAPVVPSFALTQNQGQLVHGRYFASGKATFAGIHIQYLRGKASVNAHGRVKARLTKIVSSPKSSQSFTTQVQLRGSVRKMRFSHGTFIASARLRLSDGAVITGSFHGISSGASPLSRYFKGTISGATNTNFVLRSR